MENKHKIYDSVLAGKYLMALANERGKVLNTTKVQKLLFIIYGYFLGTHGHVLLNEAPQAWPFGPVFPRTRSKIDYGKILKLDNPLFDDIKTDEEVSKVFQQVVDVYADFSASKLSAWSHKDGSPWDKTTKQKGFKWSDPIPNEYIEAYFNDITL